MASVPVQRQLHELGIPPLKRFGQHFLVNQKVRHTLVDLAELSTADTVVEVGAGLGFLTEELASRAGSVIAIEKDRTLAKHLAKKFTTNSKVHVVQGDALTTSIPTNAKIVSSPPYNISSRLVFHIISSEYKLASLLLQEDFVRRLTASSGSRDYGRITVMLQTRNRAEYASHVASSSFYPQPRVDSAIVKIEPEPEILVAHDQRAFEDLVRALFTQRRRKVRGVLRRYLAANYNRKKDEILSQVNLEDKRVYELSPIEFIRLANLVADSIKP